MVLVEGEKQAACKLRYKLSNISPQPDVIKPPFCEGFIQSFPTMFPGVLNALQTAKTMLLEIVQTVPLIILLPPSRLCFLSMLCVQFTTQYTACLPKVFPDLLSLICHTHSHAARPTTLALYSGCLWLYLISPIRHKASQKNEVCTCFIFASFIEFQPVSLSKFIYFWNERTNPPTLLTE